jgi:hypothetical protein
MDRRDQVTAENLVARRLRWAIGGVGVFLAALHAWVAASRHSMNADGVAYLDIGDAWLRGEWHAAINPVWSPMYSWILGAVMRVTSPSMRWEFPVVHAVNLALYLFAFACFAWFWRELTRPPAETAAEDSRPLPRWFVDGAGYLLFVWTSLGLIEIWAVTPDMLMAGLTYLAAGLLWRVACGRSSIWTWASLGVVLGAGYLAKSALFPLALVFLATAGLSARRRRLTGTLLAAGLFAAVALPWVVAISLHSGGPTIGQAGKLTFVRHVNGVSYPHWQGGPPGSGVPEHPTRSVLERPPLYEFATPVPGTYPVGYDPSYWYAGARSQLQMKPLIAGLVRSTVFYQDLFLRQLGGVVVALLLLTVLGGGVSIPGLARGWPLSLVALAAFGMYALVYVEGRYIGVFVVLFFAGWLVGIRLPRTTLAARLGAAAGALVIGLLVVQLLAFNLQGAAGLGGAGRPTKTLPPPSWPGQVALELRQMGLEEGDHVGVVGYAFDSFWARLARVRIVAEVPGWDADELWLGDAATQEMILEAFAGTGVRAVVAENVPRYARLGGWRQVGGTSYWIRWIE